MPSLAVIVGVRGRGAETPHVRKLVETFAALCPGSGSEIAERHYDTPVAQLKEREQRARISLPYQNGCVPRALRITRAEMPDVVAGLIDGLRMLRRIIESAEDLQFAIAIREAVLQ